MKLIILCGLLAPILYLALRQKKWYLYLVFAFLAVLPEQFSIKLHESLPLLSASRILILILMGFWLYNKWKTRNFRFPKSLVIFFAINIIISIINLRYGIQEIKRIFLLIFERILLVIMVSDTIEDREEFHRCLDFAILGSVALSVIGIVQTTFDYDISTVLHLTKTVTSTQLADRMGLMRAFGTLNAISFGCYCAFMELLILYRLSNTRSIWHSIAFSLNFVALICTFTRSAWLAFAAILFLMLLVCRWKLIRSLLPSVVVVAVLLGALCLVQPKIGKTFLETGKSTIETVVNVLPDKLVSRLESALENLIPETTPPTTQVETTSPTAEAETTSPTTPDETTSPTAEAETTPPTTPDETTPPTAEAETTPPTAEAETTPPTTPDETTPSDTKDDFGPNRDNATFSRMVQWSAVRHMIENGETLFGYGYNAYLEGRLYYYINWWYSGWKWRKAHALDVGLVALITESGFVGAFAYLGLLAYMFIQSLYKRKKKGVFDFYKTVIFIIPLYLLLNFLASFLHAELMWLFIGLYYAYEHLDKKGPSEEPLVQVENREDFSENTPTE